MAKKQDNDVIELLNESRQRRRVCYKSLSFPPPHPQIYIVPRTSDLLNKISLQSSRKSVIYCGRQPRRRPASDVSRSVGAN
jgi:hypothetical protein